MPSRRRMLLNVTILDDSRYEADSRMSRVGGSDQQLMEWVCSVLTKMMKSDFTAMSGFETGYTGGVREIPADKTRDFEMIYGFLRKNWNLCKWVALGAVILKFLFLFRGVRLLYGVAYRNQSLLQTFISSNLFRTHESCLMKCLRKV